MQEQEQRRSVVRTAVQTAVPPQEQDNTDKFAPKPLSGMQNAKLTVQVLAAIGGLITLLWWFSQS